MELTFVDLFAGVGMARMGMEQAGFKCVYTCEFDKHKRKEYEIIHGNIPEGCDIRDVRAADIPRCDVWFFGAPCQDFSLAGLRKGLGGDRSSLIGEVFRLIEEKAENKPEWLVYENVKGMLSSNNGYDFLSILLAMDGLGYDVEWQVLNTKNFGLPQNRERVYTIGHLRKCGSKQILPITSTDGKDSNTKINIVGSTNPNRKIQQRKYIYGDDGLMGCLTATDYKEPKIVQVGRLSNSNRDNSSCYRVYETDGLSPCLNTMQGGGREPHVLVKSATMGGYEKATIGDSINLAFPNSTTRRGRVGKEVAQTLDRSCNQGVFIQDGEEYVIRKLTPKECMRLQGVPDEYTDKLIQAGISDSQIYKAAGDGLSVPIAKEIGERIKKLL
jgi:DNA (cytosine-5-)-methyltransferase|nr:MAG TPA: Cytosine specific methyltransferase [Caudoviricetes sp.]